MNVEPFDCLLIREDDQGTVQAGLGQVTLDQLPPGDVLVEVAWSSLNYKDALAAQGHRGVVARLPHVPGIDAAGTVVRSQSARCPVGMPVIVSGFDLGAGHWGGWCRFIRVPANWIVPLPTGLSLKTAMIYGTAGFTAAQCAEQLLAHGVLPDTGPVVVTGATGGVGCLAVKLLAMLGFEVTASTGKADAREWLKQLGAIHVVSREKVQSASNRPLLSSRWAGAVDTVGGETLATLVRETQPHGCVTACGLVGGVSLHTTVYPFILRGVTLVGITAALCPQPARIAIWEKLAGSWALEDLEALVQVVELAELEPQIQRILRGEIRGRVLVRVAGDGSNSELPSP